MASVWYIGAADVRTIDSTSWTAVGAAGSTTSWNSGNGWSISQSALSAEQITFLDTLDEFVITNANGPRPGSVVTPQTSAAITIEDLTEEVSQQLPAHFASLPLRKIVTADDLPTTGIISAHRGGGDPSRMCVSGDGTLGAFRWAVDRGYHIIDVDYQTTRDGVPVSMHDATIDRTTLGTGNVSAFAFHQMPKANPSEFCGLGWPDEDVPSLDRILAELGGRAVLTIEAKGGAPAVPALAALIKKYGLQRSVLINTSSTSVAQAVTDAGCLPHVYGITDSAGVTAADAAGAFLIELPYNASGALVAAADASGIDRYIAGPIWLRSELTGMTAGLQGYVSDALGFLDRSTGAAPPATSIADAVSSQRIGAGWRRLGTARSSLLSQGGLLVRDTGNMSVLPGDMCGTMPGTYSLNFTFGFPVLPTVTSERATFRVCCPNETGTIADSDTLGYVIGIRANGQMIIWSSPAGFGAGVQLGAVSSAAFTAGQQVPFRFDVTPTQITLTRLDGTPVVLGPFSNTEWRGGYHWIGCTLGNGQMLLTQFSRT